jgi:hypothetical protein
MNNATLQLKIKQRLNKLASNDYDNIECWQIVEAFNKAQLEWVRRQLHASNSFREGDEQSKRRIDDLQILLQQTNLVTQDRVLFYESNELPSNYLEYKRVATFAKDECCPERSMTVYLAEEANVDQLLRDVNKKPSWDWGEMFATLMGNRVRLYTNGEFELVRPVLYYYRKPVNIEISGCKDPYTQAVSGSDINCEFKDDIVELLIDEAVAILAGDIESFAQYQRGSQSAERSN